MKNKLSILILAIAVLGMVLVSCGDLSGSFKFDYKASKATAATEEGKDSGVSFENFKTRSVAVKNDTGEDLVAFKGKISLDHLISGVPAHSGEHGLEMDPELFSATGDFALHFLTAKVFNENKKNLSAVANAPFVSIYAFYNKEGTNDLVYTISENLGGSGQLVLNNNTDFSVEIRLNSAQGQILGYVGPQTMNTVLYLHSPGDYTLYPVFKKYIAKKNEIYSVFPKLKDDKPWNDDYGFGDGQNRHVMDMGNIWNPTLMDLSSGGFYITVDNQSKAGVKFRDGGQELMTSIGVRTINKGKTATFFIPFPEQEDGSYPLTRTMSSLVIGGSGYPNDVPEYTFKRDHKYYITVTGSDKSDLHLSEITADPEPIDVNALFDVR